MYFLSLEEVRKNVTYQTSWKIVDFLISLSPFGSSTETIYRVGCTVNARQGGTLGRGPPKRNMASGPLATGEKQL